MINDRNDKPGSQAGINNPQKSGGNTPGEYNPVKDNPKMEKGVNKSGTASDTSSKFPQR